MVVSNDIQMAPAAVNEMVVEVEYKAEREREREGKKNEGGPFCNTLPITVLCLSYNTITGVCHVWRSYYFNLVYFKYDFRCVV